MKRLLIAFLALALSIPVAAQQQKFSPAQTDWNQRLTDAIDFGTFATVNSASSINLDSVPSNNVSLTGTTTVNTVTLREGAWRVVVTTGILTFTHSGTLVTPFGKSITTEAGQSFLMVGQAGGVVSVFQRFGPIRLSTGTESNQSMWASSYLKEFSQLTASGNETLHTIQGVVPAATPAGVLQKNILSVAGTSFLNDGTPTRALVGVYAPMIIAQAAQSGSVWAFNTIIKQTTTAQYGTRSSPKTAVSGGASTVTLAGDASAVDNTYVGQYITTIGGTGAGQRRTVSAYVGATRTATVSVAWDSGAIPDGTTTLFLALAGAGSMHGVEIDVENNGADIAIGTEGNTVAYKAAAAVGPSSAAFVVQNDDTAEDAYWNYGYLIGPKTKTIKKSAFFVRQNTLRPGSSALEIDTGAWSGGGTTDLIVKSPNWTARYDGRQDQKGDMIIDLATKGLVLKDTQGTPHYWRITISNVGALVITDVGTTKP